MCVNENGYPSHYHFAFDGSLVTNKQLILLFVPHFAVRPVRHLPFFDRAVVRRSEFFVFQVGVFAHKDAVTIQKATFTRLMRVGATLSV